MKTSSCLLCVSFALFFVFSLDATAQKIIVINKRCSTYTVLIKAGSSYCKGGYQCSKLLIPPGTTTYSAYKTKHTKAIPWDKGYAPQEKSKTIIFYELITSIADSCGGTEEWIGDTYCGVKKKIQWAVPDCCGGTNPVGTWKMDYESYDVVFTIE